MPFMPFQILGIWIRGLFALCLLAAGAYLMAQWYRTARDTPDPRAPVTVREQGESSREPRQTRRSDLRAILSADWFGWNKETGYLFGGLALLLWSFGGGRVGTFWLRGRADNDPPQDLEDGDESKIRRPDGTELHIRAYGPADGIPVVLVHGWGLDSNEWTYAKREMANRCRLILWDLPGFGGSVSPASKDWSLEKLASDLDAVVMSLGDRRVILAGHSIGGMIILTHSRLFPDTVREHVSHLVLGQTTYTNPVKTTSKAGLYTALQKPVLEPLCHLMIWLAPLVWLLNWFSYWSGSAHRSTHRTFFSRNESRAQLNFIARYYVRSWPGVVARGMLGMFRFDATNILDSIQVPTVVVTGDGDTTCVPEASARMSREIPQAKLLTLTNAGHGGVFEHHHQFAAEIERLISACTGTASPNAATTAVASVPLT